MKLCECGCGQPTPNRFVHGHNSRTQNPFKGKKHTPATLLKMSGARKGQVVGAAHPLWKGDAASYLALHKWVNRHKPRTGKCSTCGFEGYTEYANISGLYFRDLDDYAEMCVPCHREFDGMETG